MSGFPCTDLLADIRDPGYPAEYLYSRIRGRKSRMVTDWRTRAQELSLAPEGASQTRSVSGSLPATIWRGLLREHRWVYGQMDRGMRVLFAPYFLYAEIRTICVCLRGRADHKTEAVGEILAASLLADGIKRALRDEQAAALSAIERMLLRLSPGFAGLAVLAENEGLRQAEQLMTNRYLSAAVQADLHPLLLSFFRRIIDARNVLALYKTFKLEDPAKPVFLRGGELGEERLGEILRRGDLPEVLEAVRQLTGVKLEMKDAARIEIALYRGISRMLRKAGADPLHAGLILNYLWRCSLEAMNLSILAQTKDLDRETVMAELAQ